MMLHSWHGDYEKECPLAGFYKMCHDQNGPYECVVPYPDEVFCSKHAVFFISLLNLSKVMFDIDDAFLYNGVHVRAITSQTYCKHHAGDMK